MNDVNRGTEKATPEVNANERVHWISIEKLSQSENYPFENQSLAVAELTESIKKYQLQEPLVVYEKTAGKYEIISGHLRYQCCVLLGYEAVPCVVRKCANEDEATLMMLDAVLCQRKEIKISALARIASIMLNAYRHQGQKSELEGEKRSNKAVASKLHLSVNQVKNFVSITQLNKGLLDYVDNKRISVSTAAILSNLPDRFQKGVYDVLYKDSKAVMNCCIAKELVKMEQSHELTLSVLKSMMKKQTQEKKEEVTLKFDCKKLACYVDVSGDPEQIMQKVLSLLEKYASPITNEE